jgi:hypothetical protein
MAGNAPRTFDAAPEVMALYQPGLTRALSLGSGLSDAPYIDFGQAVALPAAVAAGTSTNRPLFTSK